MRRDAWVKKCIQNFKNVLFVIPILKSSLMDILCRNPLEILVAACRAHARIPQIGMISWDITADGEGHIVFIEMNLRGQTVWMSQMAFGEGVFGENTEEILRWVRK